MSTATEVKERPILFSAPMVRAILAGQKTMTRRVVKRQPTFDGYWWAHKDKGYSANGERMFREGMPFFGSCPYGKPGTRLWVRETFWVRQWGNCFDGIGVDYKAGGDPLHMSTRPPKVGRMCYWRSPRFMPRWASRLTLEVTNVRVERVKEITGKDVAAEGFPFSSDLDQFKLTWDKLNSKRGYSFESNPWCWVVSFKVQEQTQ